MEDQRGRLPGADLGRSELVHGLDEAEKVGAVDKTVSSVRYVLDELRAGRAPS